MGTVDGLGTPPSPRTPAPRKADSIRPGGASTLIGVELSGRYKIERLLGEGAMGAVYAAEHVLMRKRVAVKVLHPNMTRVPEVVARFEREAISASRISHPNVAAATDFGKLEDGSFFLVLEYVEGQNLRATIDRGPVEVTRVVNIIRQLASALSRAHGLGIVHRDLKPENVMLVARDGDPDFVKVLDFGIAKVPVGEILPDSKDGDSPPASSAQPLTQLGMVYGTPEYMAPEQGLGVEIDARADLYAVGVMMYELLTGQRPFLANSPIALIGMHVNQPPPPMSETAPGVVIPDDVTQIVMQLLEKTPEKRVQSAKDLLALLPGGMPLPPMSSRASLASLPTMQADASSAFAVQPAKPRHLPIPRALGVLLTRARALPKQALYAGIASLSLIGFLLVVVIILAARSGHGDDSGSNAARLAASASMSAAGLPAVDARARSALELVDHGDYTRGIDALNALPDDQKKLPEVRRALATSYAATERWSDCMRSLDGWLAQDPSIASDPKVAAMVHDAALSSDDVASALAFIHMERHMGPDGLDALYELGYGQTKVTPAIRERARKTVSAADLRSRMSPALAVTMDLASLGYSCKVKELFPRAASDGDQRTLKVLRPLQGRMGVGLLGLNDGLACIHDGSLTKTIQAIEARTK